MASLDIPGGSDGKASAYNAGDPGSISGSGRFPGEGNGVLPVIASLATSKVKVKSLSPV